ncbi:MAG TPA: PilZ domain-containing protein [Kofleriaceae bacterium]|nr:PilZ domain-containing protein [Kofleriaceae bacterium]
MEQRTAARVSVRVRAQLHLQDAIVEGLVDNLSQRGLFLCTTQVVAVGVEGLVRLELPDGEVVLPARVVRVVGDERSGVALMFATARASRALANFMMRCHASSLRT